MESLLNGLISGGTAQAVQTLQTSGVSALASSVSSSGGLFAGISMQTLLVGGFVSIVGMCYFSIGKKNGNMLTLFCGIIMCVIPYFLYNVWYLGVVSLVAALLPLAKRT